MLEILKSHQYMSSKQSKIAEYFLNHSDKIITMNIYELADIIQVSPASISRFCREIFGMSYMDTKISLARQEKNDVEKSKEIISWGCNIETLPLNLMKELGYMYKQLCVLNKSSLFETCINEIANADRVFLLGIGNSGIIAQDFFEKMIKIRKNTMFSLDLSNMIAFALMATDKDLIISISNSGFTNEVITPTKYAKERGAKIISITSNTSNPLRKLADYNLLIPNIESNLRLGAIFSRYSGFFIEDILFIGIAQKILKDPDEVLNSFNEIVTHGYQKH